MQYDMNCVMKRYMELISVNLSGTRDHRTVRTDAVMSQSNIDGPLIPDQYCPRVQTMIYGDDHHGGKTMIDHQMKIRVQIVMFDFDLKIMNGMQKV